MPLSSLRNFVLFSTFLALTGSSLHASDVTEGEALVKKSDCLSCHQPTRKVVGPAYVDVAKKYKGQAGALKKLAGKVRTGGTGVWGSVPMAAHPTLSEADSEKMVAWVLAGAPASAQPKAAPVEHAAAPVAAAAAHEEGAAPKKKHRKVHIQLPGGHGHGASHDVIEFSTDEQVVQMMKKQDCFGCHQGVNRAGGEAGLPWPTFAQLHERYKKGGNVEALVTKISEGGNKNLKWGSIPHPEYSHLPKAAVEAAVRAVVEGKTAAAAPKAVDITKMAPDEWMKKQSDCFSCHAVNQKVIGPSYKEVAKKYTDASGTQVAALVKKVKEGGAGVWGTVPMTGHATVPDAQLEKAVRWVLTQK